MVVDTSPLLASVRKGDQHHQASVLLLSNARDPLQVPALAAAEAAYLIGTRVGPRAELTFAEAFAKGDLFMEPVEPSDWDRIVELMTQYIDLPLGMADASIVALAERLEVKELATLDRRHFSVVRPNHVDAFRLLP